MTYVIVPFLGKTAQKLWIFVESIDILFDITKSIIACKNSHRTTGFSHFSDRIANWVTSSTDAYILLKKIHRLCSVIRLAV